MRASIAAVLLCITALSGARACEMASPAAPEARSFEMQRKACAAYDLHILTLIDEHGDSGEMPGSVLHDAFVALQHARNLCRTTCVVEGLASYEAIPLGPVGGRLLR